MNNFFKLILCLLLYNSSFSQTLEMNCSRTVGNVIDSFLINGSIDKEVEFKIWLRIEVDSLGNVILCRLVKSHMFPDEFINSLINVICENNFPCLYDIYTEDLSNKGKINFPYTWKPGAREVP